LSARLLLIDDEPNVLTGPELVLEASGYSIAAVTTGSEALALLSEERFDLILTDLQMPGIHGGEFVQILVEKSQGAPVVVLTGHGGVNTAVEMMQLGAADYLLKPVEPRELTVRIGKQLAHRAELGRLQALVSEGTEEYFGMVGSDPRLRAIYEMIDRIAGMSTPVFIEGEPGTGKELIARAIHDRRMEYLRSQGGEGDYPESRHPFLAVNCGAFTRTLLESQLFGHHRGAFTGATHDQEGVFVAARWGSLFLDEITELEVDLQVKLLRVLQQQVVTPLGSNVTIPVHARIITATNRRIMDRIREGRFREDLYYRIHVVGIPVPPLRERVGDIPLLAQHFSRGVARSYGVTERVITPAVREILTAYPWPGNVRELRNVIERAYALGRHEDSIEPSDLPPELRTGAVLGATAGEGGPLEAFPTLDTVVDRHVEEAMRRANRVQTRAAALLGIHRNRLARLLRPRDHES